MLRSIVPFLVVHGTCGGQVPSAWRGNKHISTIDQGTVPNSEGQLEPVKVEFFSEQEPLMQYCKRLKFTDTCYGGGGQGFVLKMECDVPPDQTLSPPPCAPGSVSQVHCIQTTVALKFSKWWIGGKWNGEKKKEGRRQRKKMRWVTWSKMFSRVRHDILIQEQLQNSSSYTQIYDGKELEVSGHRNMLRLVGRVKMPVRYMNTYDMKHMQNYMEKCMTPQALRRALAEWGEDFEFEGLVYESTGYPTSLSSFMTGTSATTIKNRPVMAANMGTILWGVAKALRYMHLRDMIHRDFFVPGKNVFIKIDAEGMTGVVHDLGMTHTCPDHSVEKVNELRRISKAFELFNFGELLHELCYKTRLDDYRDAWWSEQACGYDASYIKAFVKDHDKLHPTDGEYFCNQRHRPRITAMIDKLFEPALSFKDNPHSGVFGLDGDEKVQVIWGDIMSNLLDMATTFYVD